MCKTLLPIQPTAKLSLASQHMSFQLLDWMRGPSAPILYNWGRNSNVDLWVHLYTCMHNFKMLFWFPHSRLVSVQVFNIRVFVRDRAKKAVAHRAFQEWSQQHKTMQPFPTLSQDVASPYLSQYWDANFTNWRWLGNHLSILTPVIFRLYRVIHRRTMFTGISNAIWKGLVHTCIPTILWLFVRSEERTVVYRLLIDGKILLCKYFGRIIITIITNTSWRPINSQGVAWATMIIRWP